jgi:hypothetical protein
MSAKGSNRDPLDRATRHRLARLATEHIDTVQLEQRLRRAIDAERAPVAIRFPLRVWTAWGGLAAAVALAFVVLILATGHQPDSTLFAAPEELAQLHNDLVQGRIPTTSVANLDEARQALERAWRDAPELPTLPDQRVTCCCLRQVRGRHVACVLFIYKGTPVTVFIAHAKDAPVSELPEEDGVFVSQCVGNVNMLVAQHGDRWLCFMGELPEIELIHLAQTALIQPAPTTDAPKG